MCTECSTTTTRRQALGAAGATGVAFLLADRVAWTGSGVAEAASATCALTPNKTIGPYFVDEKLDRSDVRESQSGTDLTLTMYLFDANGDCAPISGAQVDIWHANYAGRYSDESANGTVGETWLRGYQVTDSDGKVTFVTKWPGWYSGRAVHIHFRVRTSSSDFTSQMFFTDSMNSTVFANAPYASRGNPDVSDSQDSILGSDADVLTLNPTARGSGYEADFSVGLASATSSGGTTTTSGTSTSATADTTVSAAVASATIVRSGGRRHVRVRLTAEEGVVLAARLTRGGRRLAGRNVTLHAGTHTVKVALGGGVKAGAAKLTLRVRDAAGNSKQFHRFVHVPKRY